MMVGDGMVENKPVREWHRKAADYCLAAYPEVEAMAQIIANCEEPDPRIAELEKLVKGQHHTPQKFECPHYCMVCQVEGILHPKEPT